MSNQNLKLSLWLFADGITPDDNCDDCELSHSKSGIPLVYVGGQLAKPGNQPLPFTGIMASTDELSCFLNSLIDMGKMISYCRTESSDGLPSELSLYAPLVWFLNVHHRQM